MPVNYLIIESLQRFHHYYGDDFKVEYPTNSGKYLSLNDISMELIKRLNNYFYEDGTAKALCLENISYSRPILISTTTCSSLNISTEIMEEVLALRIKQDGQGWLLN